MSRGARRFIVDFAGGDRAALTRGIALAVGAAMLDVASIALLVPILMIVSGPASGSGLVIGSLQVLRARFLPAEPLAALSIMVAAFAALMLLRAVLVRARDLTLGTVKLRFAERLQREISEALAGASWETVSHLRHGRIAHLMDDIRSAGAAAQGLTGVFVAALMLAAQAVLALAVSPLMAAFAAALIAVAAAGILPMLRDARRAGAALTVAHVEMTAAMQQLLGGLKLAIAHDQQHAWLAEIGRARRALARHQLDFTLQVSRAGTGFTTACALIAGAAVVAGFAIGLAPPILIASLVILARLGAPAMQGQQNLQLFMHSVPAYVELERLRRELDTARTPVAEPVPVAFGPIECRDLTYRHSEASGGPGTGGGVRGVSLRIAPGEMVGLSGPSGAGKSTLVDLIAGLMPPQSGTIEVAGVAIGPAAASAWRRHIAYVPQEPFLFDGTVTANLLWAGTERSEAEIAEALRIAGAEALTERDAGERGSRLSGGERQRVALARALLRGPRLLILDEALSAIDQAGEADILRRLRAMERRPAILIVSHRAQSARFCDRTLALAAGRLSDDPAAIASG